MPLVAKRKLRQSWRDAVGRRSGPESEALLARFDALCGEGREEAEAAYVVLAAAGKLWVADEPGAAEPTDGGTEEVPAV